MLNDNEPATIAELKAENLKLAGSLERCHALVADYRKALNKAREGSLFQASERTERV